MSPDPQAAPVQPGNIQPLLVDLDADGGTRAIVDHDGYITTISRHSSRTTARTGLASTLRQWAIKAFLPEEPVSSDYIPFQCWDTAQAISSYIRGMLTSQAMLRGVGVGQGAATPLAAVFTFFVRDLAGMLGGILFAVWQGASFDTCAKQWRLFADVTNDVGMAVELAAPHFPAAFLALACFGSLARAVTGVAGGATRAALTQHFAAARGNTADVSAKEGSQETATTLLGIVLGMAFTHYTTGHSAATWVLFWLLTLVHIWANVQALRCVVLTSLNGPRLEVLLRAHLASGGQTVPNPQAVARLEPLMPPPLAALPLVRWFTGGAMPVRFGAPLVHVARRLKLGPSDLLELVNSAARAKQDYLVVAAPGHVVVLLRQGVEERTTALLRPATHALLLALPPRERLSPAHASKWMADRYARFVDACGVAGWELGSVLIKPGRGPRIRFEVAAPHED